MGYRSKVIIGVKSGKLSNEFDEILRREVCDVPNLESDYLKIHTNEDGMKIYQFEQIKWYESDNTIKEIVDWLEENEDNPNDRQDGLQNVFCVGIAYDDGVIHSEVGDYWEYVDVIQDINLID